MLTNDLTAVVRGSIPFYNEQLLDRLVEYVTRRLGVYLQKCNYYYAEKDYVDINWRTIYSLHYSKTYYNECSPYCTRIHFFCSDNLLINDNYYGYIVLRPIPTIFALSKIVLKPIVDLYANDDVYLMNQEHNVSIYGEMGEIYEYNFSAWTMLIQDGVAQVCADACLNMATCYLSKKYGNEFPHYSPVNLFPHNIDRRPIPSDGLSVYEMCQILVNNGYRTYMEVFDSKKDKNRFIDLVDSNIESSLPIILAYHEHVSVIAGHIGLKKKKYIIYDDSGYHLAGIGEERHTEYTGAIDLEKIKWGEDVVFTIAFEYDKVFLRPGPLGDLINTDLYRGFDFKRSLLIEYKQLLKFIREEGGEFVMSQDRFPRYVWWVEGNGGSLVIDAACHKYDFTNNLIGIVHNISGPIARLDKILAN